MISCGIAPECGSCVSQAAKLYFTLFSHITKIQLPDWTDHYSHQYIFVWCWYEGHRLPVWWLFWSISIGNRLLFCNFWI